MYADCLFLFKSVVGTTEGVPEWCTNSEVFSKDLNSPITISQAEMATYAFVFTRGFGELSVTASGSGAGGAGQDWKKHGDSDKCCSFINNTRICSCRCRSWLLTVDYAMLCKVRSVLLDMKGQV